MLDSRSRLVQHTLIVVYHPVEIGGQTSRRRFAVARRRPPHRQPRRHDPRLVSGNTIWLDDNAAGCGWFVDQTPSDDSEFTTPGRQAEKSRMDLLTVLEHEVGHLLGHEHQTTGVMIDALPADSRRTPMGELISSPIGFWFSGVDKKKDGLFATWLESAVM